jgi:hypothetical protein
MTPNPFPSHIPRTPYFQVVFIDVYSYSYIDIHPHISLAYGISLSSDLLASVVKFLCNNMCLFYSLILCLRNAVYHGEMTKSYLYIDLYVCMQRFALSFI